MANVIIMASGLGSRMRPLTETIPKPLIKVQGIPMIESVIETLNNANVKNIYVVIGYLKEQFAYLTIKYKNVQLIENADYLTVNNISSVYYARDILNMGDTFICEADLYIANRYLLKRQIDESCYFGKFVQGHSDDWVFDTDNDGFITRIGKIGYDRYNMVGLSYFSNKDAKILSNKISQAYKKQGYEKLFWDDIVNANLDVLKLKVLAVDSDDIYEIDTVEELNTVNGRLMHENSKIYK